MATQVKTGLIANDAITDAKIANVALTGVTASSGDSSTSLATTAFVVTEINSLIDSAPGALNTLNELAASMGDDANFSTTVTNSIATKAPSASPVFTGTIRLDAGATTGSRTIKDDYSSGALANQGFLRSSGGNYWGYGTYQEGSANWKSAVSVALERSVFAIDEDQAYWSHAPSQTVSIGSDLTTQPTKKIVFDLENTRVGIGTTSPDELLSLYKTAGTTLVQAAVHANSTVGFEIKKTNATTQTWRIVDGQTVNGVLEFYDATNSATRMAIKGNGNVGIGTTNPDEPLHIYGSGYQRLKIQATGSGSGADLQLKSKNDSTQWILFNDSDSGNNSGVIKYVHSTNKMHFRTNDIDDRLVIDASGNVGIGTDNPGQTLSIDASGGANLFVSRTGQTGGLYIESDGTNGVIRNPANNPIIFQTNGANDRMQVTSTGLRTTGGLYEVHSSNPTNFVAGCAADTWHNITNYNYQNAHNGPGVDHTAQTITQLVWQNSSSAYGYIVRMYVIHGAYSANTHTIYSSAGTDSVLDAGSSFSQIYSGKYDTSGNGGLVYATLHTASSTLKIGVRFNNHTTTNYGALTMQVKTNGPPAAGTTPIMRVWRI